MNEGSLDESPLRSVAVVSLLAVAYGMACVEMVSINYLLPFIAHSLSLSNAQIGVLVSAYWASFACSSVAVSVAADRKRKHRTFFCIALLLFAVASPLSGVARSFWELLAARVIMGFIEGPLLPLSQTITVLESSARRRGMNMGIVLNVGPGLLAGIVAPICLVSVAERFGWRFGYFAIALASLICAICAIRVLREPGASLCLKVEPEPQCESQSIGVGEMLRFPNVLLCIASSCLSMAFVIIGLAYLPLYFVTIKQFTTLQTGTLMGVLGLSTVVLSVILLALADRLGRKPVAVAGSVVSVLCPLTAIWYAGPMWGLIAVMFISWALTSTGALFLATIPSESVPARFTSTVIGFMTAVSTLVGGSAFPMLAGWSADQWGLQAALLIQAGCAATAGILAMAMRETAPDRVTRLVPIPSRVNGDDSR
jgi:predicted MFS family arabinose efflux permease